MNGQKLREAREKMGLTQTELGSLVGTNARQVWRWEAGISDPSSKILAQLARHVQISVDYLLDLSDDPTLKFDDLDDITLKVVNALQRGNKMEAIRIIAAE